jgi:uncharacterized protein with PQ loop repeat
MNGPDLIGLAGALIAGYAYFPQIKHLVKEHCSAGISRKAYLLWLISSLLITINAIYIGSLVFIVLGVVQICSTAAIYTLSAKYKGNVCSYHRNLRSAGRMP